MKSFGVECLRRGLDFNTTVGTHLAKIRSGIKKKHLGEVEYW
jgi:hypothetical protein